MRILCLCLLLLALPLTATAQETPPDALQETIIFSYSAPEDATITIINPDLTVETVSVPPQSFSGSEYVEARISPNNRYIAVAGRDFRDTTLATVISIVDRDADACCIIIDNGVPNVIAYALGGFSPDNRYFFYSYLTETNGTTSSALQVYDLEAATIVHSVLLDAFTTPFWEIEYLAAIDPHWWTMIYPHDWTEEGMTFAISCYACDALPYELWNYTISPQNVTETERYTNYAPLDQLALTGEVVSPALNPNFPIDTEVSYMMFNGNVMQYYPDGILETLQTQENVIYHNALTPTLSHETYWIEDGHAVYLPSADEYDYQYVTATVLQRDGTFAQFDNADYWRFISGTTSGWLELKKDGRLMHSTYSDADGFTHEKIHTLPQASPELNLDVIQTPQLGASVTERTFATIKPSPEYLALLDSACNIDLMPRLSVGEKGRVTPGEPNNMRAEPNINSAKVGTIPGGAEFTVVDGFVCDDAGRTWWQVSYNGTTGWTVEGHDYMYWTEPVSGN